MFRGFFAPHERCAACGTRFETADGAWIGDVTVGYAFGAAFSIAAALAEIAWHPLARGLDPAWSIAIASPPVTVLAYRPAKALWFRLLYRCGFIEAPVTGD